MYRKFINGLGILCACWMLSITGQVNAQNKPATTNEIPTSYSDVSLKKSRVPEFQSVRGEDILWKRDVYRKIDLKSGQNGALYYPVEPSGDQMNLFSTIFDLVANNKITVYEYLDGKEVFTDLYAVKFKDLLKRFDIPYKEKSDPRKANASIYEIDAVDIPSAEVSMFYVKEIWFLDQRNSSIQVKTTAICPILTREDEVGESRTYPMFWVPFETLRPYLSQMSVVGDSLNSVSRLSAYDFFNQRRYQGEIIKVSNLKNQTIMDYCKTPEEIKAEQDRLEKALSNMGSSLWEPSQKEIQEAVDLQKAKAREAKPLEKKKK